MARSVGITETVRSLVPEWTVPLFEFVALFGDEFVVIAVVLLLTITDAFRSVQQSSKSIVSTRTAFIAAVVLGGLALTLTLKVAIGFPRPPESLQAVPRESGGFPSGHTMAATILWGSLALWWRIGSVRQRRTVASLVVGGVGLSRLALGVHYFVDVVASIGFGVGYLLIAGRVTRGDPTRTFAGAVVLGTVALPVTGGSTDGLLAFVGCAGGAAGWWVINRPTVQRLWSVR